MTTPWHFIAAKQPDRVWLITGLPIVFGRTAFLMPRDVARAAILGREASEGTKDEADPGTGNSTTPIQEGS